MVAAGASGAILAAGLSVVVRQGVLAVESAAVAQWGPLPRVWWFLVGSSQMVPELLPRVPLLEVRTKTRFKYLHDL